MLSDPAGGVYKKLVIKDDKLIGDACTATPAMVAGTSSCSRWQPVEERRDQLMFGEKALGDAAQPGRTAP